MSEGNVGHGLQSHDVLAGSEDLSPGGVRDLLLDPLLQAALDPLAAQEVGCLEEVQEVGEGHEDQVGTVMVVLVHHLDEVQDDLLGDEVGNDDRTKKDRIRTVTSKGEIEHCKNNTLLAAVFNT